MKLLPLREVERLKQTEQKTEIDQKKQLTEAVEKLRETRTSEEQQLRQWREQSRKEVQHEIDQLIEERDHLAEQNNTARQERDKLLVPLTEEWNLLDQAKIQIVEDKQRIYLEAEQLKIDQKKNSDTKKRIAQHILKVKQTEKEANELFREAQSLKESAENERDMIVNEHFIQNEEYQRKLDEVELIKATYQNGLNVTEMENQRLKDWEDDLIIREKDLERRTVNLRRNEGVINGNTNSISNKPNTD